MGLRLARRRAVLPLLAAVATGAALVVAPPAGAVVALTPLSTESFNGTTTLSPGWNLPSGSNAACLTAGSSTVQKPIPGCSSTALDPAGSGALRLTSGVLTQVGTVYNTTSLPTAQGLDINFTSYQYGGNTPDRPADGISFVLAATDPTNPAPPTTVGPAGGSLGYSPNVGGGLNGVSNGYLGFGLDVYGNYSNSDFSGTGCPATSPQPKTVTVRGPGNGTSGYCILSTTTTTGNLDNANVFTRSSVGVPVEIALNPAGTASTTSSGLSVPAHGWVIKVTSIGAAAQVITGTLPSAAQLSGLGFPASWYDASTGLPYQLTFGWAASTGSKNEIHEINTLSSQTVNGQLPSYTVGITDNVGGASLNSNSRAVVTVTPALAAGQGSEPVTPTVTTTFPTGWVLPSTFTSGPWNCTGTARVASCSYTGTVPIAAGATLAAIDVPVTVAGTAGTKTITTKISSNDGNPATTTRTVTVTALAASATPASVGHGTASTLAVTGVPSPATGSIAFTSGGATLCTATLPATSCTTGTALAAGSYPVTVTYSGDSTNSSATATTTLTVTRTSTSLTASVAAPSVSYGTGDALTAGGLPSDATGTITFSSGGTTLCSATLPVRTCTPATSPAAGSYPVTASWPGDTNYTGGSAGTSFTVTRAATTIAAAVSSASVAHGTQETLSSSGLPVATSTTAAATGTVTYVDGSGTTLCTQTVPADSSCLTPALLAAGSYSVTAHYGGDTNFLASDAAPVAFDVTRADTTAVTASVSAASTTYGTPDTLSLAGLPVDAGGTITFRSGSATLCTATLPITSCATPVSLAAGSYPVTADYSGDANYQASTATTSFTVTRQGAPVGFAAAANPSSTVYGTPDVLSFSGLPAGATGSVTFTSGGTTLCTASVTDLSCSTPADLGVGDHAVTATYSGDGNHEGTTATTTFRVTQAGTSVTASVASATVAFGTPEVLTHSGLPTDATGTVTFTSGGTTLCTATLPAGSCRAPGTLAVAGYPVTATYSGDANHTGSTATTTFAVVIAPTTMLATVSDARISFGDRDTLAASGITAGATGTVTFSAGGTTLCTATLPTTSCRTSDSLAVDSYAVTARYSGDAGHAAATATTAFTVTRTEVQTAIPTPPATVNAGSPVTLKVTGVPSGATGKVTFRAQGKVLCTVTLPDRSCTTTDLPAGSYAVTASYSGDDSYAPDVATQTYTVAAVKAATATSGQQQVTELPSSKGARSIRITAAPAHGDAQIQGGRLVYTPAAGFTGTEHVTVTVTDATGHRHAVTYAFTVSKARAVEATSGSSTSDLAATGSPAVRMSVLAAVLLAVGVAFVVTGRRRGRVQVVPAPRGRHRR